MRRDTLQKTQSASIATQQGYHSTVGNRGTNYAFAGFTQRRYFTSDRFIPLNERFERADGKPLKGFGLEIEVECSSITNDDVLTEIMDKIVTQYFPDFYFKYQRDGSLGGRSSVEAITQPATKEFLRNNYPAFKVMFNSYFSALGISASASGNCGMHVNVSLGLFGTTKKTQDEAIRKLFYIINKHYNFFVRAFYRNPSRTDYCARMNSTKEYAQGMDLNNMSGSHGNCLNYGHYPEGRIEIRLVGGQKDFACFRNTMETVFHLIDAVKVISWKDCDSLPAIFKGCNAHVYDRISTYCLSAGVISQADVDAIRDTANLDVRYI